MNDQTVTIAVASGKGGTGKTTVAANLARVLTDDSTRVMYLDCDVEEPNGHIFLRPVWDDVRDVTVPVPEVDQGACIHCGKCGRICQFSAIIDMGVEVLTFPDLCHSCGGCSLVCPVNAITESPRSIGVRSVGRSGSLDVAQGELNIGHPTSPPVIRAVKSAMPPTGIRIIDSPPGTSCPVIESVSGAQYVILVTEPTPFGLSDLRLAVELLETLDLPHGIVINRADAGDRMVHRFCTDKRIPILMELPDDRRIAEAYSRGELAVERFPEWRSRFLDLAENLRRRIRS